MSTQTTTAFEADLHMAVDLLDNCACCSPCDFSFYFVVTISGGSYPFQWLGNTWTSSGQSLPVCGTGIQQDFRLGGTPTPTYGTGYYGFELPRQDWEAVGTGGGMNFISLQPTPYYIDAAININKAGTISPFAFNLNTKGWTFSSPYSSYSSYSSYSGTGSSTTATGTSNLVGWSPTGELLFSGAGGYGRLSSVFEGSLTTTAGRTISWAASPDFPWDYDNP